MTNNPDANVTLFHPRGFQGVCAFHTLRMAGNMDFRFGPEKDVLAARRMQFDHHYVPRDAVVVGKVGTTDTHLVVTKEHCGLGTLSEADAPLYDIMLTDERGIYLAMLAADCVPMVFHDPMQGVVAIAHAGHAGLTLDVPGRTIRLMQEIYVSDPANIFVDTGPFLQKMSARYTHLGFAEGNPDWEPYISPSGSAETPWLVDLKGMAQFQLERAGVPTKKIRFSPVDTRTCARTCYSYRGHTEEDHDNGRMMTVIGMRALR